LSWWAKVYRSSITNTLNPTAIMHWIRLSCHTWQVCPDLVCESPRSYKNSLETCARLVLSWPDPLWVTDLEYYYYCR
jgi:hypothetical protein